MANVLVDTSVWVDFFRKGQSSHSARLDGLLERHQAVLCGVVEMELLQGVRPEEKSMLQDLLNALPYAQTDRTDYQTAGEILKDLQLKGIKIPATDALIAALCSRHSLALLTLDKHFDYIRQIRKMNF